MKRRKKILLIAGSLALVLFSLLSVTLACSMDTVVAQIFGTPTLLPSATLLPPLVIIRNTVTPIPPTETYTPVPPTATSLPTNTPIQPTAAILLGITLPYSPTPIGTDTFTPTPTVTLSPTVTYTPTITFTPTFTLTPTPTLTPTITPSPTLSPTPYPTKNPQATFTAVPRYPALATVQAHFVFVRPISNPDGNFVSPGYRYGETQQGLRSTHYGVDMPNPEGEPVLAAGDGVIIHAGDDWTVKLGPEKFFYGNAVVIKHNFDYNGAPVFTLYGHLSQVNVSIGQTVSAGQTIGLVGGTGVAAGGNHLHFEVRVGYNDYDSTRNPELWLQPYPSFGAIAGRVTDNRGKLVARVDVSINATDGSANRYVFSYEPSTVNPDEKYGENWAVTDLPPGEYSVVVKYGTKSQRATVIVPAGGLGWVEFSDAVAPPTWTATPTPTVTPRP